MPAKVSSAAATVPTNRFAYIIAHPNLVQVLFFDATSNVRAAEAYTDLFRLLKSRNAYADELAELSSQQLPDRELWGIRTQVSVADMNRNKEFTSILKSLDDQGFLFARRGYTTNNPDLVMAAGAKTIIYKGAEWPVDCVISTDMAYMG